MAETQNPVSKTKYRYKNIFNVCYIKMDFFPTGFNATFIVKQFVLSNFAS